MYGLVNKAIEGLVCKQFGEDTWFQIVDRAGVDADSFISMDPYPDEITYRLVGAASETLDIPADDLLEAFGVYWIQYVGSRGYGPLMNLENRELFEFLEDLDQMHSRVADTMPELRPPRFTAERLGPKQLRMHYHSDRAGLGPMVAGLLRGLLQVKELEGEIRWTAKRSEGAPHEIFEVTLQ
ncbi:MAG: heme NO-binding domain-containing protein [Myxococcota bacterium]|nr:heme NO-binding domain-containing protein [Myxococcota bacterium]